LAGGGGYSSPIPLIEDNLDKLFAAQEFGFQTYTNSSGQEELTINTTYARINLDSYHTVGHNKVFSGFALYDFTIIPKLKLSSGIRAERTDIFVDVFKFDSLGYAAFDERRFQPGEPFMVNPGIVKQWNFLPSANLIYKLKTDESAPTNIRLGYSKTIARPSVRELTETFIYDYEFRSFIFGNSSLKTVEVHNFDVRAESYFKSGDNVSVSLFYKKFFNHIELVQTTQGFSWQNADESEVKGIEIDARKKIVKGLDFRANLTFTNSVTSIIQKNLEVKSGVKKEVLIDTISRAMSGQAPYVLNGILSYNFDSLGLVLTASYNVQGPRLAIATSQPDLIPDVYEMPRHLFDFKVSKTLGKYFVVSATVKDIFNAPIRRSYKYKEGYLVDFDSYRFGTNYYVSLAYRF
jgi:outer membrane receptor protein involved in Fe transport